MHVGYVLTTDRWRCVQLCALNIGHNACSPMMILGVQRDMVDFAWGSVVQSISVNRYSFQMCTIEDLMCTTWFLWVVWTTTTSRRWRHVHQWVVHVVRNVVRTPLITCSCSTVLSIASTLDTVEGWMKSITIFIWTQWRWKSCGAHQPADSVGCQQIHW